MLLGRYVFVMTIISVFISQISEAQAAGSGAFRAEIPDAGAMGKGSAFVGEANTPAAVYYNPAGLTQIKSRELSVGTTFLGPQVDYKNSSGAETQMRRNTFLIPHFYAVTPVNSKLAIGLGATSYFGLGTEWADDSSLKYVATESSIENKDYMLTAAYQVTDQWSVAVSADSDDSKVSKKKKLLQGGIGDDGNFQLKAKHDGWGYRLATLYKVNEQHQFGLMYRSPIRHKYRGKAYLDNLNNNNGSAPYQAIFGGTSYETEFSEEFVLPQSVVLGYSFKPISKWTFNLDVEWMDWSSVEQERINWESESDATRLSVLNDGNPASRDWKSAFSQAIGAEYAVSNRFRLRGGYYHHQTPIPQDTFEPNLPDSNSHGLTTGFGYDLNKNLTFDLAYSGLIYEKRKIDNNVGSSSGASIDGAYRQFINVLLGTVSYRF